MSRSLHGWRRKIRVLTLLLACLFMAGWVRSQRVFDIVGFPCILSFSDGIGTATMFSSARGIVWVASPRDPSRRHRLMPYWSSFHSSHRSYDQLISGHDDNLNSPTIGWTLKKYGIGYGKLIDSESKAPKKGSVVFLFPYWLLVIPLTVVSVWLLLFKQRDKSRWKIAELSARKLD